MTPWFYEPLCPAMQQRKREAAALVLTIASMLVFLPPLVLLFSSHDRVLGVPIMALYFFLAWALVIALAGWLAHRLGDGGES